MSRGDVHRELADALDDLDLYRTLLALLPWTVHYDHRTERVLARIPAQRPPSEPLRRDVPRGAPATPNTRWGTRSSR